MGVPLLGARQAREHDRLLPLGKAFTNLVPKQVEYRLIPARAGNTGYQMLYYEALRLIPARARNTLHHNYMLLKNFLITLFKVPRVMLCRNSTYRTG